MDKTSLVRLFENPDFKEFTEQLCVLWRMEQNSINALMKGKLDSNILNEINYHLAKRTVLEEILFVRKGILDELLEEEELVREEMLSVSLKNR